MTSRRIQDYDPSTLHFTALFEEFESIRHPEDGERLFAGSWFIQAEEPDGVRWRRHIGISNWVVDNTPSGDIIVLRTVDPQEIRRKANELEARLRQTTSPCLNPDVWEYAGACYGSDAYESLNLEAEMAAWERADNGTPWNGR